MNGLEELVEMARENRALAEQADRKATRAVDSTLETQHALGRLTGEVAQATAAVKSLDKFVRASLAQLGQAAADAKKEARRSQHDLEQFVEDSKVTSLRKERDEAKVKYESLRARDKTRMHWVLGIVAAVVATVIAALIVTKLGLK